MPTGTGVVDAFKNFIRHGKTHHSAQKQQDDDPYQLYTTQQPVQQQPRADQSRHQQQREAQAQQHQTQKHASPKYKEQIEQIVQEEREAKNKMPTYTGLENFRLLEKMGDGAFSNVYKAVDLRTGQKVAVKVVRKYELSASQGAGEKHLNREFKKKPRVTERANILKEVQIMRGINHPSIVKLLQFFESPEHYFLVLELMEGGELFHQIVKLTYFSENLARHVIVQVAQGIRYLHEERGVVHRDIKPENLLFDRIPIVPSKIPAPKQFDEDKEDEGEFIPGVGGGGIGKVKIADFGLSKVVWDEQTMTPCGTVGYTAPEIVKDERYSKSVDMWALGCVLYTLLCGFPPFYDESINVLTEKVARGHYTFLSPWWDTISASAKDLITHLLCVDPAQRYTIDEFLAHSWVTAVPAPPDPTPLPSIPRAPLDSPLLADARGGVRSPGLATLKEAFDITYAVHRMEEEGARRRAQKGGANRGFLQNLNESDEDEDAKPLPKQPPAGAGAKVAANRAVVGNAYDGRAGQRDRGRETGASKPFELDMDHATLLGRRHRRGVDSSVVSGSPLSKEAPGNDQSTEVPMSPMRVD
ncbi:Pkinase-domain-containing protein [Dichomitus squalens]|uniref:Pkinase-domain-containing protein n=1 Tax=Dichomitus squalens TaxID=114155 RepID=A0A4Q9N0M1_9APHY|nr:Pkinase-domain-containing protein [Dichomitus squalens]